MKKDKIFKFAVYIFSLLLILYGAVLFLWGHFIVGITLFYLNLKGKKLNSWLLSFTILYLVTGGLLGTLFLDKYESALAYIFINIIIGFIFMGLYIASYFKDKKLSTGYKH